MLETRLAQWDVEQSQESKERFLLKVLTHYRHPVSLEKECQLSIAKAFDAHAIPYKREVKLAETGIIDFVVDDYWGIEIKIKGSRMPIYRQCKGYCSSGMIKSLILATMYPMSLPSTILDIPSMSISLSTAHLKRM